MSSTSQTSQTSQISQTSQTSQAPNSSQWSKPDVSYMTSTPTVSISSQTYENRQPPPTSLQWSTPYMP